MPEKRSERGNPGRQRKPYEPGGVDDGLDTAVLGKLWSSLMSVHNKLDQMQHEQNITINVESVIIINVGGAMDFTRVNAAVAKNKSVGEIFGTIYPAIADAIRAAKGDQAKLNALADQLDNDTTIEETRVAALKDLVTPETPSLAAVWNGPTSGVAGESYSGAVAASGGEAPYSFTQDSGALPDGVTFSSDGSASGTPGTAGEFELGGTVTDAAGASAQWSTTITVS